MNKRKIDSRLFKLEVVSLLIELFFLYNFFKMQESVLDEEFSLKDAKEMGNRLTDIMGIDISYNEFLRNKDERNNELIDSYKQYKEKEHSVKLKLSLNEKSILNIIESMSKDSIITSPFVGLFYPKIFDNFSNYVLGFLTKEELIRSVYTIDFFGRKRGVPGSLLRKVFFKTFEIYKKQLV